LRLTPPLAVLSGAHHRTATTLIMSKEL
jgi:hypothetical protein